MTTRSLPFFLDFISPYSYLAWVQLRQREQALATQLEPRPVLFAGLLDAHGTLGPAEVEAKRSYVFTDCLRKAHALRIELNPPFGHPFNPLLPLRLTIAARAEERAHLVDLLYSATWKDAVEVSSPDALGTYLRGQTTRVDVDQLMALAETPGVKASLRQRTEKAIRLGVFGVPTVLVDSERFWGVDSLDALEATLARGSIITVQDRNRWSAVQPKAQRTR